jgi:hypothetical protein
MGETADDIEEDIDHSRHALQSNLEELESRMRDLASWRRLVRKHPGPMVLAALAGGMLVAAMIGKR